MDLLKYDKIRKDLKKIQTKQRYTHTLGVAYTASALAMRYGVDIETAYVAGLLHDCAKCVSDEEQLKECEKYNIPITKVERSSPYLLHGKLGACYARERYGITNQSILDAIICHTTGKPAMNVLEQIIFIADYIEPSRDLAQNLTMIRKIAFESLDKTTYFVVRDILEYLQGTADNINTEIDVNSIHTFNYYSNLYNDMTK